MKQVVFALAILAVATAGIVTSSSSPADRVIARVDHLIHRTNQELAKNLAIHNADHLKCKNEKKYRNNEIHDGTVALENSQEQLKLCRSSIVTAKRNQKHTVAVIEATRLSIKNTLNERATRAALFKKRKEEMDATIVAIEQSYTIINSFKNSGAKHHTKLAQIGEQINSIYMIAINNGVSHHMTGLVTELAEMMGSQVTVTEAQIKKLVGLFRALENKLKSTLEAMHKEDRRDAASTAKQVADLRSEMNRLLTLLNAQNNYISEMAGCISKETRISRFANEKISRNKLILSNTIKMCAAFEANYKAVRAAGENYVALLGKFRKVVVTAINGYSHGRYHAKI